MNKTLIAVLLAFLLPACGKKVAPPVPQVRTVLAFTVEKGAGFNHAEYSGEVKPRHETALAFRVGGKLIERLAELGQRIVAGQPLARLDPADLTQSRKSAEAQLAAAKADLAFADAEVERFRGLKAQQFVSAAALDGKETALKAATEKVRAAEAQHRLASNQSAYASLSSDVDGVVSAVLAEAGQVVAAGQAVLKVARTDEKEVLVALPENRVTELSKAGELAVSLWALPDKRYRGRVREIAPQADPLTRTFAARVSILNADAEVRLGQTARVVAPPSDAEGLTLIPLGSVFQQGKQPAVWLIAEDGHVHLLPVRVSAWREDGVAVGGGLSEGMRIVAAGAHKLVEGEAVRVAAP